MKKTTALILLALMLALSACGQNAPAAETPQRADTPQSGEAAQLANPWREVTESEAKALCDASLRAPEGAENVTWRAMEAAGRPALVQLSFDLNGYSYTARAQATGDRAADISGMYYTWTVQDAMTLQSWPESAKSGTCSRYIGENEWAELCAWYDTATGISYTLSVTAKDLDGFDLQAIAEALCAAPAPAETGPARQDGERFETVIILEGMEETVQYEHIRSDALGLEMDYDYESFLRESGAERERFISVWDDPAAPENYLELTRSAESADAVAAAVRASLSGEYDLLEGTRELAGAGSCIRVEASVLKGSCSMADQIQVLYIFPAADGCRVATAHYAIEAAEGFGRRFNYMLNTLTVLDGRVAGRLTDEQALTAIRNYCYRSNPDLEGIVSAGDYDVYWEITSSSSDEIVVLFRSYTGAQIRYYVNPVSGETTVTEFVPGITPEEMPTNERLNAWAYLG